MVEKSTDPDVDKIVKEMDEDGWIVDLVMRSVGLKRVEDTVSLMQFILFNEFWLSVILIL